MRRSLIALAVMAGVAMPVAAQAEGCLKGAAVGGVAGHFVGHHAVLGALAGCAIGHHRAAVRRREQRDQVRSAPDDDEANTRM